MEKRRQKIGIFLFNEVEVLDFAGPYEVFSLAEKDGEKIFQVVTISERRGVINARNGLKVIADYSFEDDIDIDILLVPGGYGAEEIEIKNKRVINWIKNTSTRVKIVASICTGAFLLAKSGVVSNHRVTTHWMDIERLEKEYPNLNLIRNVKYIDEGDVLTSGGISAGIELSLYIIGREYGEEISHDIAKRMEYLV